MHSIIYFETSEAYCVLETYTNGMKWFRAICLALLGPAWLVLRSPGEANLQREGKNFSSIVWFSGYEWQVKTSYVNVGPGPNVFSGAAVKVDQDGYLHLGIVRNQGRWLCSEVASKRNFGYGDYRFNIRNSASIDVNAVLGLFLWDPTAPGQNFREVDIEVSRWGEKAKPNAQFVVQPDVLPGNRDRFELPTGRAELSFKWTPGRLFCRAVVGRRVIAEHLFTRGISEPGLEHIRLNAWLYRGAAPATGKAVEIVLESFTFTRFDPTK